MWELVLYLFVLYEPRYNIEGCCGTVVSDYVRLFENTNSLPEERHTCRRWEPTLTPLRLAFGVAFLMTSATLTRYSLYIHFMQWHVGFLFPCPISILTGWMPGYLNCSVIFTLDISSPRDRQSISSWMHCLVSRAFFSFANSYFMWPSEHYTKPSSKEKSPPRTEDCSFCRLAVPQCIRTIVF